MDKVNNKIREDRSVGDRLISFFTYVLFGIFALICVYPFYYIFINTISSNELSQKGMILFWPAEIHFTN